MKNHRVWLGVCLVLLLFAACTKTPESKIVGVWKGNDGKLEVLFSLRADGSGIMTTMNGEKDFYFRWALANGKLTLSGARGGATSGLDVLSIGSDEINFRAADGGAVMSFRRVADQPPPPTASEMFAKSPGGIRASQERDAIVIASLVDKAVLNNARQLAAAADQQFLENGVSTVTLENLVGATNYVKALNLVANETYPSAFTQGVTITVGGIAGQRTITYAP